MVTRSTGPSSAASRSRARSTGTGVDRQVGRPREHCGRARAGSRSLSTSRQLWRRGSRSETRTQRRAEAAGEIRPRRPKRGRPPTRRPPASTDALRARLSKGSRSASHPAEKLIRPSRSRPRTARPIRARLAGLSAAARAPSREPRRVHRVFSIRRRRAAASAGGIARRHQNAGRGRDRIGDRTGSRADHRQAVRDRFRIGHAEALIARGEHEQVGRRRKARRAVAAVTAP